MASAGFTIEAQPLWIDERGARWSCALATRGDQRLRVCERIFNAAGDPSVFPDQIAAGLQPWQPLKVYARVPFAHIDTNGMFDYATNQYTPAHFTNYVTGKVTTTVPKANVVVPEGSPATYTAAASVTMSADADALYDTVLTVRTTGFDAAPTTGGSAAVETLPARVSPCKRPRSAPTSA